MRWGKSNRDGDTVSLWEFAGKIMKSSFRTRVSNPSAQARRYAGAESAEIVRDERDLAPEPFHRRRLNVWRAAFRARGGKG